MTMYRWYNAKPKIKMYVINLKSHFERYTDTLCSLKGIVDCVEFHRIDAIDTRNMTPNQLWSVFEDEHLMNPVAPPDFAAILRGSRRDHHELSSGSCGCLLTHTMRAWKAFIDDATKNEDDVAIFAEDDLCISYGTWQPFMTASYLKKIQKEPMRWMQDCDILLLSRGTQQNRPLTRYSTIVPISRFFGLWAYMLTKKSARKLLFLMQHTCVDRQLDWKLSQFAQEKKIQIKTFTEPLFDVRGLDSTTQNCQRYVGHVELYTLVD